MATAHDVQPQFATRHFRHMLAAHTAQGKHRTDAVAVADVAVDETAQLRRGIEHLLGIDGHEYAGTAQGKVNDLLRRGERVYLNSFQVYLIHSCKLF